MHMCMRMLTYQLPRKFTANKIWGLVAETYNEYETDFTYIRSSIDMNTHLL